MFAPSLFLGAATGVWCLTPTLTPTLSLRLRLSLSLTLALTLTPTPTLTLTRCHAGLAALLPSDLPLDAVAAYAVVGAAATVSSVVGAPLTASVLAVELTHGTDLALPLLAATGTGPLASAWLEARLAAPPAPPPPSPPPPAPTEMTPPP